jgi:hypothetical protein
VTPAVLSSEVVHRLFAFFEERLRPNALGTEAYPLRHRSWTEYTLYYTYLEHTGLFDAYYDFPRLFEPIGTTSGTRERNQSGIRRTASTSLFSRVTPSTP